MGVLETIRMVITLLPMLIQAIKAVEEALPGAGKGAAKLAIIRGVIESADSAMTNLWPVLENVVAVIVATFNKTGVFSTDPKPPAE